MNRKSNLQLILISLLLFYILTSFMWGTHCKVKAMFSKDKYCYGGWGNYTTILPEWRVGSYKQDLMNAENARIAREQQAKIDAENQACYNAGYLVNKSFDILKDYGFTQKKLEYINDHLIDRVDQKDGGYIKGSSSGFGVGAGPFGFAFSTSSGEVDGKFYEYVVTKVLATGQLVENINYWVDCTENKYNENIDYYSEAEFVMYYVNNYVEARG